jgi:hypothetical protein
MSGAGLLSWAVSAPLKTGLQTAPAFRDYVWKIARKSPNSCGVETAPWVGDRWSLEKLAAYARVHGPPELRSLDPSTIRYWLKNEPQLRAGLNLYEKATKPRAPLNHVKRLNPVKIAKVFKSGGRKRKDHRPPKGYSDDGPAEAERPVTLVRVQWLERPILPITPREQFGADCRPGTPSSSEVARQLRALNGATPTILASQPAVSQGGQGPKGSAATHLLVPVVEPTLPEPEPEPAPATQTEINDAALLLDGEIAWQQLKQANSLEKWFRVGKALLILRRLATEQAGCYKGIKYAKANAALLDKHGFREITRSTRQSAMLVVENWPAIERWISGFEVDRKLNHPLVIWRGWLASKRKPKETNRHTTDANSTWRNRELTKPVLVQQIVGALRRWFPDEEPEDYRSCAHEIVRIFGYAVPRALFEKRAS